MHLVPLVFWFGWNHAIFRKTIQLSIICPFCPSIMVARAGTGCFRRIRIVFISGIKADPYSFFNSGPGLYISPKSKVGFLSGVSQGQILIRFSLEGQNRIQAQSPHGYANLPSYSYFRIRTLFYSMAKVRIIFLSKPFSKF